MQDLAYAYARNTGGNTTDLAAIIATYAPAQVTRYKAAQTNAINGYANTDVVAHNHMYLRTAAAPLPTPPSTGLDSTIQEIYLDFRTSPTGALGPTAAAYETCVYTMGNLAAAYGIGYTIGSGLNWLLQTYTPSTYDAVGGTIDQMLTNLGNATSDFLDGKWDLSLADLFNVNIGDLWTGPDSLGDFGLLDDVELDLDLCINPGDC
jgi:hypothetical protein